MFYQKCHFFFPKNVSHLPTKYFIRKNPCSTTIPIPENQWLYSKQTPIFHFSFLSSSLKGQKENSDFSIGRSHKFQKNHPKRPSPYGATLSEKPEIVAPLIFKKYKKSTLRKAHNRCISILGFNFFNRTFTQIFKKSIFRTIFIWRHCKSPRPYIMVE